MKIGKSDLSKDQLKKLLEAVAAEEEAAKDLSVDEQELAEEERRLSERLRNLADKDGVSAAIDKETAIAEDQLRRERNLQAIKQKLAQQESPVQDPASGLSQESPSSSRRWVQVSSFLAVAALLAIVVRTLPEHTPRAPIGPDAAGTRFKGQQVDVADCDYSVLQDQMDLERLEGLQTRFLAPQDGNFDIVIKCVPAAGYVHAFSLRAGKTELIAQNMQIETSQRQFLRVKEQGTARLISPFWTEGDATSFLLFLTQGELSALDEDHLPQSLNVESLGGESILWADEFVVIKDNEDAGE